MAALGLQRVGKRLRLAFDTLTYMSVIVPEIVIALSTLVLFATGFDALETFFGIKLNFGHATIIAAHVLFNISLVLLLVRARLSGMDRTLVDASADLFATPWRTFRQITFPQLLPAIVAGFLLSFTFSFDDYVITSFVVGSRLVDAAAVHLRPGQARGDARDQRRRDADARVHAACCCSSASSRCPGRHAGSAGGATAWRRSIARESGCVDRRRWAGATRPRDYPAAAPTASGSGRPASAASSAALSVRSQGRSRSGRPKWPYAAVWR